MLAAMTDSPTLQPISFLSDFGHADEFVGVVHGVIERIAPNARVIDIGHEVPRGDIRAMTGDSQLPYLLGNLSILIFINVNIKSICIISVLCDFKN